MKILGQSNTNNAANDEAPSRQMVRKSRFEQEMEFFYKDKAPNELLEEYFGPRDHLPSDVYAMVRRVNPHFRDEWVMNVEELTDGDSIYRNNCALCTPAILLQFMGYNAEAKPLDTVLPSETQKIAPFVNLDMMMPVYRGINDLFDIDYDNPNNFIVGPNADFAPMHRHKIYDDLHDFDSRILSYNPDVENENLSQEERAAIHSQNAAVALEQFEDAAEKWGPGAFGEIDVAWLNDGGHSMCFYNQPKSDGSFETVIICSQSSMLWATPEDKQKLFELTDPSQMVVTRCDNAEIKPECIKNLQYMFKKGEPYTEEEKQKQVERMPLYNARMKKADDNYSPYHEDDYVIHGIRADQIKVHDSEFVENSSLRTVTLDCTNSAGTVNQVELNVDACMLEEVGRDENGPIYNLHINKYGAENYGVSAGANGTEGLMSPKTLARALTDNIMSKSGGYMRQSNLNAEREKERDIMFADEIAQRKEAAAQMRDDIADFAKNVGAKAREAKEEFGTKLRSSIQKCMNIASDVDDNGSNSNLNNLDPFDNFD